MNENATAVRDETFLPEDLMDDLRRRWEEIQTRFVDDPEKSVGEAHGLVTDLVNELTDTFTRERETLEGRWKSESGVDTENLRIALKRYRAFFNRLLV